MSTVDVLNYISSAATFPNVPDISSWQISNVTLTTGVADPFGGTRAISLTETAVNGQHIIQAVSRMGALQSVPANTWFEFGFFAKAGTRSWIRPALSGAASEGAYFNLSTGTGVGSGTDVVAMGNGWFLCRIFTSLTNAMAVGDGVGFWISTNGSDAFTGYLGVIGSPAVSIYNPVVFCPGTFKNQNECERYASKINERATSSGGGRPQEAPATHPFIYSGQVLPDHEKIAIRKALNQNFVSNDD